MASKGSYFRVAIVALLLVPMTVTSTSPLIQWYIFDIEGQILRSSGGLENHSVALLGYRSAGREWKRIQTCNGEGAEEFGPFITTSLTTAEGRFSLRVSVCGSGHPFCCDTLAVALVSPDTMIIGSPFRFDAVKPTLLEKTGTEYDSGGCACDDDEYTYVDGYIYEYPPDTLTIP